MRTASKQFDNHDHVKEVLLDCCALCNSRHSENVSSGYDYELETCGNLWHFQQCEDCGHIQLNPRPHVSELPRIYPVDYYAYSMSSKLHPLILWGKEFIDAQKISSVLKNSKRPPSSYLDVGCGDGRYLKILEDRFGVSRTNILGLELEKKAVDQLTSEGFHVQKCRVEDLEAPTCAPFDLITMFHVIEHVDSPVAVISKLRSLLSTEGQLIIETPNTNSMDFRFFMKSFWGGYHFPRHWHLFNDKTILELFEQCQMNVAKIVFQPGHSFWLYSLHHLLKYELGWKTLAKLFDPMNSFIPLILVTGFDKCRAALGFRTSSMLVVATKSKR